jgi:hypothetical protein
VSRNEHYKFAISSIKEKQANIYSIEGLQRIEEEQSGSDLVKIELLFHDPG